MAIGTLATVFIAGKTAELQLAIAARMLHMNAHAAASAVEIIEAAQENMDRMVSAATGVGENLDVSV